MNDHNNDPGAEPVDLGTPVTPLEDLEDTTSTDFIARIRTKINRRTLASQSADLSFLSLFALFKDYLEIICQAILGPQEKEDE